MRVKMLCNDLAFLEPPRKCVYDDKVRSTGKNNRDNLIKFLNGLNEQYNLVRNQINGSHA